MTKDEALDLALEALEHMLEDAKQERLTVEYWNECVDAITAIKQARSAPVQVLQRYSPDGEGGMELDSLGAYVKLQDVTNSPTAPVQEKWGLSAVMNPDYVAAQKEKSQQALDVMAENARELGLDYEPVSKDNSNYRYDPPVAEPVAYLCENAVGHKYFRWKKPSSEFKPIALYTTPPTQPAPVQEPVEFGMHGKKMMFKVGVQQFTLDYEPDTQDEFNFMRDMLVNAFSTFTHGVKTTPTAAQRQWVGLTDEEREEVMRVSGKVMGKPLARAIEAKLKEKNT